MVPTDLWDRRSQRSVPVWLLVVALALIAGRIAVWSLDEKPVEPDKSNLVQWVPLAQAEARARATGKPILYDFTAAWCGPCHELDAAVFRDARLASIINQRFIAVRVVDRKQEDGRNTPEVDALQRKYSVRAFPTLVFADAGGAERKRMEGFGGAERFEEVMRSAF